MTAKLDCADIQCNVLQPVYYPKARFFVIEIPSSTPSEAARAFVLEYRKRVTTELPWRLKKDDQKPDVAINIAFSWYGLRFLGLPVRTLAKMPAEFIDGMAGRALILGDETEQRERGGKPVNWDRAWLGNGAHILVCFNARMDPKTGRPLPALDDETKILQALCEQHGLVIRDGHTENPDPHYQDATAVLNQQNGAFEPTPKEHFGFTDGIGNPVFEGQFEPEEVRQLAVGSGKLVVEGGKPTWEPLATGEFLLGHPDEAQEIPGATVPDALVRNGTFLVYRKLHQNVASFNAYMDKQAASYARLKNVPVSEARDTLMAKMAGRWPDGVPLSKAPTFQEWKAFNKVARAREMVDFTFQDDGDGAKCPITSHLRRTNTRDSLDPSGSGSSKLNNRRRLLRRGLPYGEGPADDDSGHGVIMLILCASIARQFEFVQQQWLQYGLDSSAGNDDCPLLGARLSGDKKFVVPVKPENGEAPFICIDLPKFVEARGGEYFFLPSMTALRMIGMGTVDPT